jgi:hypothetical protein
LTCDPKADPLLDETRFGMQIGTRRPPISREQRDEKAQNVHIMDTESSKRIYLCRTIRRISEVPPISRQSEKEKGVIFPRPEHLASDILLLLAYLILCNAMNSFILPISAFTHPSNSFPLAA